MWKAPFSKFGGGAHIGRSAMESECDDDAIKSDDDDCDILKMIWRWNEMEEYIDRDRWWVTSGANAFRQVEKYTRASDVYFWPFLE